MDYRNEVIKRVETEILTTSTGETRNLLTDVNIALQTEPSIREQVAKLAKKFKDAILSGNYTIHSWQDFYCEIIIENYYFLELWHRDRDILSVYNPYGSILLKEVKLTDEEAKIAHAKLLELKKESDKSEIVGLEIAKKQIEEKLKWLQRND